MSCPKCGGTGGVYVHYRAMGQVRKVHEWSGEVYDTGFESLSLTAPKTGICGDCNKRIVLPREFFQ